MANIRWTWANMTSRTFIDITYFLSSLQSKEVAKEKNGNLTRILTIHPYLFL